MSTTGKCQVEDIHLYVSLNVSQDNANKNRRKDVECKKTENNKPLASVNMEYVAQRNVSPCVLLSQRV